MKRLFGCLLSLFLFTGSLIAGDWDPMDDTFDPSIQSVVIGNRSWLGDPSPFVHVESSRTGYTHVRATNYEGFDPSVSVSLMVPLEPGEAKPPAGGMLMLNAAQATELVRLFANRLATESKPPSKATAIKNAMKDTDWSVSMVNAKGKRFIQLQNKLKDQTVTYRFSASATKKLAGAIQHSMKQLDPDSDE